MENEMCVLIVDNKEVERHALAEIFSGDYTILYTNDEIETKNTITANYDKISVVLLRVISGTDGMAILKWIMNSEFSYIPVVVITSVEKWQISAIENGAADFIAEPFNPKMIRTRIQNVLSRCAYEKEKKLNDCLKKNTIEMNNLINSVPGGIAIYRLSNILELVYFSDGIATLSGYTREEYKEYTKENASIIIYEGDRKRVCNRAKEALKTQKPIEIAFRINCKNGNLLWINLNAVIIGKDENSYLIHTVFQKSERMAQLYASLVNSSSTAIYVSDVSNHELLYINQEGLNFVGKTNESFIGKKCYEFLFNSNKPCRFCKVPSMNYTHFTERDFEIPHKDCVYHLRGKLIDWNGIDAHVEYIEDITKSHNAKIKNQELTEQLQSVIEHVPGGMCLYIVDENGIKPMVHNQAFYKMFGYSKENLKSVKQKTTFLNVHPEDIEGLQTKLNEAIRTSSPCNHTYRVFNDEKNAYVWIYLDAIILNQPDGRKFCYVSYTDVTKERKAQEQLLLAKNEMQVLMKKEEEALKSYRALVNTVPGGIALYEIVNGKVITDFYSDGLCELSGYTREEIVQLGWDAMTFCYGEDVKMVYDTIQEASKKHANIDVTYRINTKSGIPRWINLRGSYSTSENGNPKFHAVFTDVDNMKRIEKAEKEQQIRYEVAIKSSGINVWEYDIPNDKLVVVSNSSRIKQNCFTIENYIASTVENGYVREDSLETFYSIFEQLKSGVKEVCEDIWYKTTDAAGWWCERVIYTTVFDVYGKPLKAFGAGRDVTREKEAILKFDKEMSYRAAMQEANIDSIKINLTQNTIIEGDSPFQVLSKLIEENNADEYFLKTTEFVIGAKNKKEYMNLFNRQSLLSCFNRGDFALSLEFPRIFDTPKIYWIRYNVHLMKNPETDDVIAFIIANDITDDKVTKSIMETIAKTDYDFFVVVDGTTNTAIDYTMHLGERLFTEDQPFEERNEMLIRGVVCKEDVERVIEECRIQNVLEHIKDNKIHKFDFNMKDKFGRVRRKQVQLTLIDWDRKSYLMSRIDVTGVYKEQIAHQKELEKALISAKQANLAKSDFLARMSHDIRTPMNAIIGMSELAKYEDNPPKTIEYLENIDSSSHYLLGLINDILDVSKIESGKIKLHEEPYTLEEFMRNINTVIVPLMEAKHINFVYELNSGLTCILTDKLRFTQIYFNLLSNAAKFTPDKGHIEFVSEHLQGKDGKYGLRCYIRDNGIGMSEEFLEHLFEPFTQEKINSISMEQGTGLGLTIVKNLVEAMGGSISVKSERNKGTEFKVDLYVKKAELITDKKDTANRESIDLSGRRILLVEDNDLNTIVAKRILERKGCRVDVAIHGLEAVRFFMESPIYFYDAILMDLRMPVMGGLDATKKIRSLSREDAPRVPIIAMTADAFVEDQDKTKKAGMDAHLSKPIEPIALYQTLYSLIQKRLNKEN